MTSPDISVMLSRVSVNAITTEQLPLTRELVDCSTLNRAAKLLAEPNELLTED